MDKENTKAQIREMGVGEVLPFPIDRLPVIRTYASELSIMLERRYRTITDRENRTISVERVS